MKLLRHEKFLIAFTALFLIAITLITLFSLAFSENTTAQFPSENAKPYFVNINTASLDELDTLNGIGPVLASRIIEYRDAHGDFSSVNELKRIPGIGDAVFKQIVTNIIAQ